MSDPRDTSVTYLLARARNGDPTAFDQLFPLVYDELRGIAHAYSRRHAEDQTLNTTALVHEAYIRLVDRSSPARDRAHFLAVAARAMRHIMIDNARRQNAQKRGGPRQRLSLDAIESALAHSSDASSAQDQALLALEDSLKRLEMENERHSRIVECRFFGGMTIDDTAEALGISAASVKRGWSTAKAWLYRDLCQALSGTS
jgi:RNA polymerase sigma factor (TIGR02999 family)